MGAALTKCFGSVTSDPSKMSMIIGKSFGMFDKDKSGFIDAAEASACCQKVLSMAHITNVSPSTIDGVFAKVAGPDKKLDKAEFTNLVNEILAKAGAKPVAVVQTPAAHATAPADVPPAAAAAAPQ